MFPIIAISMLRSSMGTRIMNTANTSFVSSAYRVRSKSWYCKKGGWGNTEYPISNLLVHKCRNVCLCHCRQPNHYEYQKSHTFYNQQNCYNNTIQLQHIYDRLTMIPRTMFFCPLFICMTVIWIHNLSNLNLNITWSHLYKKNSFYT